MKSVSDLPKEELEKLLADCITKSAQKDIFIASVVHDMKNLMVPILTRSEMLQLNISEEKKLALLNQLNKSCMTLMDALQKMVSICKDRNNASEIYPTHFNLHNLVIEVLDAVEEQYETKEIDVQNAIPEDVVIFADRNIMISVLMNLVGNAIKFNNIGGKILIFSEETESSVWKITVQDSGIGINEEQMFNLINENKYYTTPGTMGELGTGLGLMLCVSKLQRSHSTLEARNNSNGGASFSFYVTNREWSKED